MLKPEKTPGDTSWFVHDRFGMFIHWGTYALAARHEWIKHREEMGDEDYEKRYFRHFDPDLYDPALWAKAARKAGMKYFVVTTKHHEGFCLWDSDLTDYKAPSAPYGKDALRPMVEAFRDEDLRAGFYHSLIDWHHPHYPIDGMHPMRNRPDTAKLNRNRDIRKYREYLRGQVRELLTRFGRIDIMWFDFSYSGHVYKGMRGKGKADWESEKLIKLVRSLQPHIIINDRLEIDQDIKTPEQYEPQSWLRVNGKPAVWEACHTFSGSWGYYRDETTWKNPEQLLGILIRTVARGGNLLMNVGPTGRGEFDERALDALDVYARWMRVNSRSIYGCTQSRFKPPAGCEYTQNGKRLYLHIFTWPFVKLYCEGLAGKVEYAQFLHDASEVPGRPITEADASGANSHGQQLGLKPGSLELALPVLKPNVTVPVIEIFLK